MKKTFTEVVPFWPLSIADSQNYFLQPALVAQKAGFNVSITVLDGNKISVPSSYKHIPVYHCGSVIRAYLSLRKSDVVHCQTAAKNILKLLLLLTIFKSKNRLFWTPHTSFGTGNPFAIAINIYDYVSFLFKYIDTIIAINPFEYQYLRDKLLLNTCTIPLPIDIKRLQSHKKQSSTFFNIIFIGGDRKVKGLEKVLEMTEELIKKHYPVRLHIIGLVSEGLRRKYVLYEKNILYHGVIQSLSDKFFKILSQGDIYINNSYYEGSPVAAYEAAACGLPLCLSDLPTLHSIFGSNALYHRLDDINTLQKNVLTYLIDKRKREDHVHKNLKIIKTLQIEPFGKQFAALLSK